MKAWLNTAGELIVDENGAVVLCDECPCDEDVVTPGCGCADIPSALVVTIAGVTNGAGCTDCNIINGEYEIAINAPDAPDLPCGGIIKMPGPDCFDYVGEANNFWIGVTILPQVSGFKFDIRISDGDAPEAFFETTIIEGDNCCAVNVAVSEYFGPVKDCDWSGATVNVRAVC
jgi:hypothetical protein